MYADEVNMSERKLIGQVSIQEQIDVLRLSNSNMQSENVISSTNILPGKKATIHSEAFAVVSYDVQTRILD